MVHQGPNRGLYGLAAGPGQHQPSQLWLERLPSPFGAVEDQMGAFGNDQSRFGHGCRSPLPDGGFQAAGQRLGQVQANAPMPKQVQQPGPGHRRDASRLGEFRERG